MILIQIRDDFNLSNIQEILEESMKTMSLFIIPLFIVMLFSGCEDSTDPPVDEIDPEGASAKVEDANKALENELFLFISQIDDHLIDEPGNIDFTLSNSLYKEALVMDPDNLDANFGAGLTEILIVTQDAEIKNVFDAWEAFIDTGTVFEPKSGGSAMFSMSNLYPIFIPNSSLPGVSEREFTRSYFNMMKMGVSDPPTIEDIQVVIEENLIPKLVFALERLNKVDSNSDYTFTITPKMLGDLDEDALELDLTEIFLMETSLNLINSFSYMLVAYSYNFDAYDSAAIVNSLSQGSGFLALRTNGAAAMSLAKSSLLDASSQLDEAIAFLKAETDDQSDDIIKISPDDLEAADLDSIVKYNADFREYLNNGWTLTEDWDDDFTTDDEPLTLKFSALFDTPIVDYKALLPDYTVRVERDTSYDYLYDHGSRLLNTNVTPDSADFYRYNRNHSGGIGLESTDVDTTISIPGFGRVIDSLINAYRNDPDITYYSVSLNWSGFLNEGSNQISATVNYDFEFLVFDREFYTAFVTFEADNFDEWIFPNTTFNGFLPDITTDAEFKRIFGIVESDFEKEVHIHFDIDLGLAKRGRDFENSDLSKPFSFLTPWLN